MGKKLVTSLNTQRLQAGRGSIKALAALIFLASANAYSEVIEIALSDQKGVALAEAVITLNTEGMSEKGAGVETISIDQVDKEFVPEVTVVQVGTAISFPNNDNILHHVYSFSDAKTFDLPLYQGTPSEPVVFDKPGLVTLGCNIHDWMRAYVVVVDTPYYRISDETGKVVIGDLPPGEYELGIWHPRQRSSYSETLLIEGQQTLNIEIATKPQLKSRRHASGQGDSYRQ